MEKHTFFSKKRKVDKEGRVFNAKWTEDYFCVPQNDKICCLICHETINVFKHYNVRRHYETKHQHMLSNLSVDERKSKLESLQKSLSSQRQTLVHHVVDKGRASVRASYKVANILSKRGKPLTDGTVVQECLLAVIGEICSGKLDLFNTISLSAPTMTRRVTDIAQNLEFQLKAKASKFVNYSFALDDQQTAPTLPSFLYLLEALILS